MVHEDVEAFEALPEFAGFDGATAVLVDELEELVEGDVLGEDDGFEFADELFFPHGSVPVPVLQQRLELLEAESFPAKGEPSNPVHGHHVLRQHGQALQHLGELLDAELTDSPAVGLLEPLLQVGRVLLQQLVQPYYRIVVVQVVLLLRTHHFLA